MMLPANSIQQEDGELQEQGRYSGFAGLEYHPTVTLEQTMSEVRACAQGPTSSR